MLPPASPMASMTPSISVDVVSEIVIYPEELRSEHSFTSKFFKRWLRVSLLRTKLDMLTHGVLTVWLLTFMARNITYISYVSEKSLTLAAERITYFSGRSEPYAPYGEHAGAP